jgi:hypothetical protein
MWKNPWTVNAEEAETFTVAAGQYIPFGACVMPSGNTDQTVKAAVGANVPIVGVAGMPKVEMNPALRQYPGFWSPYEEIPVFCEGVVRVPVISGKNLAANNIDLNDGLEVALIGSTSTAPHGVLEEAGTNAGQTPLITCVARALEAKTLGAAMGCIVTSDVAIGDTTVTTTAANIAAMGLEDGDHIMLEDITGQAQHNIVKSHTATVLTLNKPSTVALVNSDSDVIYKINQVRARLQY